MVVAGVAIAAVMLLCCGIGIASIAGHGDSPKTASVHVPTTGATKTKVADPVATDDKPTAAPTTTKPVAKPRTYKGHGDDVVEIHPTTDLAVVVFDCRCNGNTVLKSDGPEGLLVNEIGGYSGTRPLYEPALVQITADDLAARLCSLGTPAPAAGLVLAAYRSEESLTTVLAGEPVQPDDDAPDGPSDKADVWLEAIRVRGFRGIDPEETLKLQPNAGLTLVIGRNGSGKSSFAEAAELALTDDSMRWAQRPVVFRDGWRNLHYDGDAEIALKLRIDGRPAVSLRRRWKTGATGPGDAEVATFAGRERQPAGHIRWLPVSAARRWKRSPWTATGHGGSRPVNPTSRWRRPSPRRSRSSRSSPSLCSTTRTAGEISTAISITRTGRGRRTPSRR